MDRVLTELTRNYTADPTDPNIAERILNYECRQHNKLIQIVVIEHVSKRRRKEGRKLKKPLFLALMKFFNGEDFTYLPLGCIKKQKTFMTHPVDYSKYYEALHREKNNQVEFVYYPLNKFSFINPQYLVASSLKEKKLFYRNIREAIDFLKKSFDEWYQESTNKPFYLSESRLLDFDYHSEIPVSNVNKNLEYVVEKREIYNSRCSHPETKIESGFGNSSTLNYCAFCSMYNIRVLKTGEVTKLKKPYR